MIPRRLAALVACCVLVTGCATHVLAVPANVQLGPFRSVPRSPQAASVQAAPSIVAMSFSSLDVARGSVWSGRIITSRNAASVEVRTNLFSIDVPRTAFGSFAFRLNVLDTPSIFVRAYRLRVIARNAVGAQTEEDLPFRIR